MVSYRSPLLAYTAIAYTANSLVQSHIKDTMKPEGRPAIIKKPSL